MSRKRGFEEVPWDYVREEDYSFFTGTLYLPERSSQNSAGYDFFSPGDFIIKPGEILLVPTGVCAYMQPDEVLKLYDRSSNPLKKGIVLINSVGVIDSDYYGNSENGGMIYGMFKNITDQEVIITRGDAIMQGVFQKYLLADGDDTSAVRTGGLGSSGN